MYYFFAYICKAMLKILKASAGSGKTYNLAREYIRLILSSDRPDAYRHVLAVTFTNKATDEMKRRILKELHRLATRPADSPYLADLVPAAVPTEAALQQPGSNCRESCTITRRLPFPPSTGSFSRRSGPFRVRWGSSPPIRCNWTGRPWSRRA